MLAQHQTSLGQPSDDIIEGCFKEYAEHLRGLEQADINVLKKRIGQLKGMQKSLNYDLRETDENKKLLLRQHEDIIVKKSDPNALENKRKASKLRTMVMNTQRQIDEHRGIYAGLQDKLEEYFEDVKMGCDDLAGQNRADVLRLYGEAEVALSE